MSTVDTRKIFTTGAFSREKGSGTHFSSVLHIDMNYTKLLMNRFWRERSRNTIPVRSHWKKHWMTYPEFLHFDKIKMEKFCKGKQGVGTTFQHPYALHLPIHSSPDSSEVTLFREGISLTCVFQWCSCRAYTGHMPYDHYLFLQNSV